MPSPAMTVVFLADAFELLGAVEKLTQEGCLQWESSGVRGAVISVGTPQDAGNLRA